jgi:nicotinate-nucleotide adenylyltransferase
MRIGILGGSFDPVHLGHLAAAEACRDALSLDRVLLVVAAGQPLKPEGPRAPAEDRYAMVRLACRGRRGLEACDVELRRPAPSYTVDTLRQLARERPDDAFVLLLGADAARDFPRWREPDAVRALAEVVPFTRAGVAPDPAVERLLAERGVVVAAPEISSTEVRRRLAAGLPVADLVGGPVADYLAARGLYRAR